MRFMLTILLAAMCVAPGGASAQATTSPAPSPLTSGDRFRMYLRQTYSLPSVLLPASFAGLDQAADSPGEWDRSERGYFDRFATQRGQFQIGAFCKYAVGTAFHEDPRFFPSGKRGLWTRTVYVLTNTLMARSDDGKRMPAFANYTASVSGGFAPAAWLPPSANSLTRSLQRTGAMLGMIIGMNMGIEFRSDDSRFFHDHILNRFHHGKHVADH